MITPTPQEMADFIESHELVIQPSKTAYGEVYGLVSGDINYACPYEFFYAERGSIVG